MATIAGREWLSPSQTARELNLSLSRVRQLTVVEGKLGYVMTPLGKLIDGADVARLAAERQGDPTPGNDAA